MSRKPLALIVAHARNRCIGKDGDLPWHEPEDLRHFKRMTQGHALIMGRRSCESLPGPLPGRRGIVISRSGYTRTGFEAAANLDQAITLARESDPMPFICGGAGVYLEALPLVTHMYLTLINRDVDGDTFFPEFDESQWRETELRPDGQLLFRTLLRNPA